MLTLGIETSCDETSAAVVEDGRRILSNVVSSQVAMHAAFGGVVPELAARSHVERLPAVVDEALGIAGVGLESIELVAVTRGPGLVGALLTGVGFAAALGWERGIPVVGVSHLDGHLHSAFLEDHATGYPLLVLVVSGGHTELILNRAPGQYELMGRTLDDAAGEAFDKVARMLGLAYPGGPEIERAARSAPALGDRWQPLGPIRVPGLDFSFSGIKTAVRYRLERIAGRPQGAGLEGADPPQWPAELVAAAALDFQGRAVGHLVDKLEAAVRKANPASVAVVGGVALNGALRSATRARLAAVMAQPDLVVFPGASLCTDNAAMIAAAGHALYGRGLGKSLRVDPSLRWESAA
ncbi:MAG: tRNA (adenosine(37)-N6)-threonylcarbamoyltransferase complex transferase subunit TsaD [Candidatus Dormibacteria bacterium]